MTKYDLVKDFERIWKSLKNESERGSIIVAAAICDDILINIISKRLIPIEDQKRSLFKGDSSLISNFSARIDMAYSLGCISENMRKSLHIIRDLRNDFAHASVPICMQDSSVKDRLKNLLELNRKFVEFFWKEARSDIFLSLSVSPPEIKNEDLLSDILHHAGHRHAYEIWASAFIANLGESIETVMRIEKYESPA